MPYTRQAKENAALKEEMDRMGESDNSIVNNYKTKILVRMFL